VGGIMHPIIEGELGRQRREGFDREVAKAALVAEARAYREATRAAERARAGAQGHPSRHQHWAHLFATMTHPHLPHRPAH
jgi:hypothetical protein